MFDFDRIAVFQWDQGNTWKSVEKHSVSWSETEQAFFNEPLLVAPDAGHGRSEPRFHALGGAGHRLHVTFTLREENTRIRIISARDMSRKERARYEQET